MDSFAGRSADSQLVLLGPHTREVAGSNPAAPIWRKPRWLMLKLAELMLEHLEARPVEWP
jgi:hypothetical protein